MIRLLTGGCWLAAVVLAGWGLASAFAPPTSALPAAVTVENPDRDLGLLSPGSHEVIFRVVNPTDRPARVIDSPTVCGNNCCFGRHTSGTVTIPAGGSADVVWDVSIRSGPFGQTAKVYVAGERLWLLPVHVHGVGTPAGATP